LAETKLYVQHPFLFILVRVCTLAPARLFSGRGKKGVSGAFNDLGGDLRFLSVG